MPGQHGMGGENPFTPQSAFNNIVYKGLAIKNSIIVAQYDGQMIAHGSREGYGMDNGDQLHTVLSFSLSYEELGEEITRLNEVEPRPNSRIEKYASARELIEIAAKKTLRAIPQ